MIVYIFRGSATLSPRPEKKIIYNNLKKFICLPFKKNLGTPSVFFMRIKLNFAP